MAARTALESLRKIPGFSAERCFLAVGECVGWVLEAGGGGGGAMDRWMRAGRGRPRRLCRLPMMKRSVAPVNLSSWKKNGSRGEEAKGV